MSPFKGNRGLGFGGQQTHVVGITFYWYIKYRQIGLDVQLCHLEL